jgi:hypothetical protein
MYWQEFKSFLYHTVSHITHITWFSQHSQCGFGAGWRRDVAVTESRKQDLCADVGAEHLIFKTSTEKQTVDLTNKDMTNDFSQCVEDNR